jgi:hypothetical protein
MLNFIAIFIIVFIEYKGLLFGAHTAACTAATMRPFNFFFRAKASLIVIMQEFFLLFQGSQGQTTVESC